LEFYLKHQQVILRSIGAVLLLVGFVIHFWVTPQPGISKNDRAAANLARMEASVAGSSSSSQKQSKPDTAKFLKELKNTQAQQAKYLTIIMMILGVGSLGYSFVRKREED